MCYCGQESSSGTPQGELGLFNTQSAFQADRSIGNENDDQAPVSVAEDFLDADSDQQRLEDRSKAASSLNPEISLSDLRSLTTCRLPNLNLTRDTVVFSDEWFVFTYCHLDIVRSDETGLPLYPRTIPAFRRKISAFNFMLFASKRYLNRKFGWGRSLSTAEKLDRLRSAECRIIDQKARSIFHDACFFG
jgi:hypothetical protein